MGFGRTRALLWFVLLTQMTGDDCNFVCRVIPESCRDVHLRAVNIARSLDLPCNLPFTVLEEYFGVAFQTCTVLSPTNTSNHTFRSTMVIWLPPPRPYICSCLIRSPTTSPDVHNSDIQRHIRDHLQLSAAILSTHPASSRTDEIWTPELPRRHIPHGLVVSHRVGCH